MPSPWAVIDTLLRELRSVRDDARALDPAFARPVVAEVAGLIEHADLAVEATIGDPESEILIAGAKAAIGRAGEHIRALETTASRPAEIVGIQRRREPARQPYNPIVTHRRPA